MILLTYRHGLPDETWHEPNPVDPLSLIDQVKEFTLFEKYRNCEERKNALYSFPGGVGVGLQLRRLAHQEEPRRLCAQESEAELHEN